MTIKPQSMINGRYRIGRKLGEGGMAVVYLGHDLILGRDVAVKTLRAQFAADPAFRTRFEREARAAASLSHANIIDVYDVGEDDGLPFIIMEYVPGQTLQQIIAAEAPFHPDDVAALLTQIAAALDYAHARGYVHRDIKPGNILVDDHGRARVADFGIAKSLADSDLTDAGTELGTVGYLSPEQASGLMATPASDVYSAGVVAFEMLTGQLPFPAETPVGVAMRHINDPPPRPSRVAPGVPREVDAIVLRALAKDPTKRWPSVGAFARAMHDWRDNAAPRAASPATRPIEPVPAARGGGSLLPTVVVVLLVAGALAALLWTGFRSLGDGSTPAPTPIADAPAITGGLEPAATVAPAPVIVIEEPTNTPPPIVAQETIVTVPPTQPPAEQIAPTIAPVSQGSVIVPNLQGMTIGETTRTLLPLDLRIALDQPVFSDSIPMNSVVSQDPPPGTSVAPGSSIRVSLSRGRSPFGDGQP